MKLLIVALIAGLTLVVAVGGMPGIIASQAGYEAGAERVGAAMPTCDQGPKNSPTSKTHDLDEVADDWGVFCEKLPTWSLTNVTSPSLDGKSLRCSITGGAPYANVHCYRNLRPEPETSVFKLTVPFYFTPATTCNNEGGASIVQALEFSMSKWHQGQRYEFALQWLNVGSGAPQWRYWDPHQAEAERWVPLSPAITQCLAAGKWHTLSLEGDIINGQVYYRRFMIDQQSYNLKITVPPAAAPGEADRLAVAVQLDGNFEEAPYHVFIDQVSLVREPALRVTKQASPSLVQDGAPLTYTIRVVNQTSSVTLTASITDILPSHVTPNEVLNWTPVTIEPGGAWAERVVVTAETGYTGSLTNKVEVTTQEGLKGTASVTVCSNRCISHLPLVLKKYPPTYNFEGDFQGWGKQPLNQLPLPGQGVTLSTERAYRGSYSLRFDDLGPYASEPTGTTQDVGVEYNAYSQKITAFVYLPHGAPSIPVVIYVQDGAFEWHQGLTVNLTPGVWKRVAFDGCGQNWPSPYKTVGLHFTPGNYTGPVFIDKVRLEYCHRN